jgi:glycosyltransferase involved in cell wall biosynthesis
MESDLSHPLVTVLVCLYNGARFIDAALQSVFAQTCQSFNLVVIDDGSTDGGADAIERRYGGERLTVVRRPHEGLNVTRAVSLRHATGEYVAFLDQDDVWLPRKLERQLEAARATPGAALVFSDTLLMNEAGQTVGVLSHVHPFTASSVNGGNGYLELLRRGCFICFSTAVVRRSAATAAGGFDARYRYAADYDLWLRMARHHPMAFVDEPLARYRVHPTQFTQRFPEITLPEQVAILEPMRRSASYPASIRAAIGDNLYGQHWLALPVFVRRGQFARAARTAAGMLRYPDRIRDSMRHRMSRTFAGPIVERAIDVSLRWNNRYRQLAARVWHVSVRARRAPAWLLRQVTGIVRVPQPESSSGVTGRAAHRDHVWVDGSALSAPQVGHFNLTCELIRSLAERDYIVHVTADRAGRAAIHSRLNRQSSGLLFDPMSSPRSGPRRRAPVANATEVLVWRGSFRWRDSRRLAIVPDLTPHIHPQLHTAGNIADFNAFMRYAQRHAHGFVTLSQASRQDIICRLPVCPDSVTILPMPIDPQYEAPSFSGDIVEAMGISTPYVLCVGTIEPRKNLRRLVQAFQLLREGVASDHTLVLAGPLGWDATFTAFLREMDASWVHLPGYVPLESLPSLYHLASAVAYPSVYEGFGLPVLEAMCCSAVVVASNVSAVPEVLGSDAVQFDPYSVEDIAGALQTALTMSPDERARYRARNRRRALAHLERLRTEPPLPGLQRPTIETA